jgi:hypothetical protein
MIKSGTFAIELPTHHSIGRGAIKPHGADEFKLRNPAGA